MPASGPVPAAAPRQPVKLPGWLDQIVDRLGDKLTEEVRKLGEVAVSTASSSLQHTVEQVLPKLLGNGASENASVNRFENDAGRNGFQPATTRI